MNEFTNLYSKIQYDLIDIYKYKSIIKILTKNIVFFKGFEWFKRYGSNPFHWYKYYWNNKFPQEKFNLFIETYDNNYIFCNLEKLDIFVFLQIFDIEEKKIFECVNSNIFYLQLSYNNDFSYNEILDYEYYGSIHNNVHRKINKEYIRKIKKPVLKNFYKYY